jgi:AcrR family transcriptional regulator
VKMHRVTPTKEIKSKGSNKDLVQKKQLQILSAAAELFTKKGYHATSMREISQLSGINLSYIYNYVSSKDDILYLFYYHLSKQWAPLYEKLRDSKDEDPIDQLKEFLRAMLEIIVNQKKEFQTGWTEGRHLERESLHAVLAAESEVVRCIEQLIIRGQERGVFSTQDAHATANLIQLVLMFYPLRSWNFNKPFTFSSLLEFMTISIMKLLGVDEPQTKKILREV